MKDKGFWLAFGLFTILFIADMASTFISGELAHYLEINPLYRYGGFVVIIAFNIALMTGFWWFYTRVTSPTWRFVIMAYMVLVIVARIFIVANNLVVHQNLPTVEVARQITVTQKNKMFIEAVLPLMLPILPTFLTYYFWQKDHKIEKK